MRPYGPCSGQKALFLDAAEEKGATKCGPRENLSFNAPIGTLCGQLLR
jgi:hypothetical protein